MKSNYDLALKDIINNLDSRKKLLLHSCCGPCSSYVLDYLNKYFDITILYYNPNIYPHNEYLRRLSEQVKLVNSLNNEKINIIFLPYNEDEFLFKIKGLEDLPEGSKRCHVCYELRMEQAAVYAKENNYDFFTTTLTVSPYKDSENLNKIGENLQKKYNIKYLYADFKKNNGYKKSIELSKKYNLYRQNYCGCRFSKNLIETK